MLSNCSLACQLLCRHRCAGTLPSLSCFQPSLTLLYSDHAPGADIPADGPLFPVPKSQRYLTWEPDQGGLNNIRMQVRRQQHTGEFRACAASRALYQFHFLCRRLWCL